jgi:hypothetical protein
VERVLGATAVRGRVGEQPTTPSSSMTEPGQPCVMISGNAFSWRDLTWMEWMPNPSISVLNSGRAFSSASHVRQL